MMHKIGGVMETAGGAQGLGLAGAAAQDLLRPLALVKGNGWVEVGLLLQALWRYLQEHLARHLKGRLPQS